VCACAIESPHVHGACSPHSHMLKCMLRPVALREDDIDWYDFLMSIPEHKGK
jgi:hypothetical protein